MKKIYVFVCLFCWGCSSCLFNRFDLECKVQITNEYVFFDHCYNGLIITELEVEDSSINLYPYYYVQSMAYELLSNDTLGATNKRNLKIYFNKVNGKFQWKKSKYKDMYTGDHQIQDTIQLFKPATWYLFSFMNPHFEAFAFCDSSGKVSFVKKDLNANF